jgi:hypothetical protein
MVVASIGLVVGVRGACLAGKAIIVVHCVGVSLVGSCGNCGAVTVVGSVGLVVVGGVVTVFPALFHAGCEDQLRIFSKFDTYGVNFL